MFKHFKTKVSFSTSIVSLYSERLGSKVGLDRGKKPLNLNKLHVINLEEIFMWKFWKSNFFQ